MSQAKQDTSLLSIRRGLIFPIAGFTIWFVLNAALTVALQLSAGDYTLAQLFPITGRGPAEVVQPNRIITLEKTISLWIGLIAILSLVITGIADRTKDLSNSIVLDSGSGRIKYVVETLQGRHSIFKNSQRGWHHVQALFVTCLVVLCLITLTLAFATIANCFAGSDFTVGKLLNQKMRETQTVFYAPAGFLSLWYVVYQRLLSDYSSKWLYCAGLYNKVLDDKETNRQFPAARISLALDLLYMDLWAKRAFAREFSLVLNHVIDDLNQEEAAKTRAQLQMRRFTEDQAHALLEDYLHKIRLQKNPALNPTEKMPA